MNTNKHILKQPNIKASICIFCYHKVGTVLLSSIFQQICQERNWSFKCLLGRQTQLPENVDVVLFGHSLIYPDEIKIPFKGIHIIRDPRDIIVSGYQYHYRTTEEWCINSDLSTKSPILYPKVPYSQQHRSEEWKVNYLQSLNGMSYQENLLNMSQSDGLLFELNNYGAWTIDSIKEWDFDNEHILELKFENLMNDYDNVFQQIFQHLGFSDLETNIGMNIAIKNDLRRMTSKKVESIKHVSSIQTSRWKDYFELVHKEIFCKRFGNVLIELGYEKESSW